MHQAIEVNAIRLHCDQCGHHSEPITPTTKHIGTPCPKCGANTLTAEDYAAWEKTMAIVELVNTLYGPIEDKDAVGTGKFIVNPRANSFKIERDQGRG